MVDSVTLDGTVFTEASFAGENYANPDTGILAFGAAVVGHGANLHEGESTTSLTIGAGTKIAQITAARPIFPDSYVEFVDAADASNHMGGEVDSYDKVTGDITFTVTDDYAGSGTISDWLVYCQGKRGRQGNPGTPASTTQAGIVELATSVEVQDGTDTARAVTPAGLSARTATETRTGLVELATSVEVQDGTDTVLAVTPAGLSARTATEARTGLVELATNAEVQGGTDTARAVTPAGLASRTATETRTGIAEIATQAEVDARTDNSRIVTPDKLAHGTGLTGASITAGSTLTLPAVGDDFPVSGTGATITAMSARTPAGRTVRTTMAGANTLVHSSALALFTGANIVTAAGDVIDWKSTAAGWAMIGYERADGTTVVPSSRVTISTFTASNSVSIEFTTGIDATFSRYIVEFDNLTVASSVGRLQLRLQVSGSWQTSNYKFFCEYGSSASSSVTGFADAAATRISFSAGNSPGSTAGYGISGSVLLLTPANTSIYKKVKTDIEYMDSAGELVVGTGGGSWVGGTGAVTGIQLYMESGNIASGTAKLIGLR